MYKRPRWFNTLFCTLLFLYQCSIDLNKNLLVSGYNYLEKEYLDFLPSFILSNDRIYTLLYFLHRAFIHGAIVRIYTGKKYLVRVYMIIDLTIFSIFALLVIAKKSFDLPITATDFSISYLMKLWNSPLLLLFFLPSFYLFANSKNSRNKQKTPQPKIF
jgi:hypothetical protein